ncbi:GNAT family N-acetyltransferase [Candidatus Epulonipiscium fishelsonii]|uniref:GNAT family N-acetyltransferase n=1 Tax=Candidatus Epulonipiscium fishelsonii TaxID=77094 RepID=A0ACC8X9M6_9FIRM|nr:GNAT family N-acetyltransferase [Epulopiscium sp. SCG-B11WGA-EpuloA1]ONI41730.1 GNAT family N-acetyltransferase [Epulopiscium sp. SCG-B05WGA-EpuloA1]
MKYREFTSDLLGEIKAIYADSNWQSYLKNDDKLKRAFDNSQYVLGAFDDDKLVGFVRCVGDEEYFVLVQDLIVLSKYQQKGLGTYLFKSCWDKYQDVRMFHVVTDIEDKVDNHFYQSFNMKKLEAGHMVSYFR